MTNSASDDKACVSKFNQVENDLQNYINAQMIILQDAAYDCGFEAGQAAALRSRPAGETGVRDAAQSLLDKMDKVIASDKYKSVWHVTHNHRGPYRGENYENEMNKLRAALTASSPAAPAPVPPPVPVRGAGRDAERRGGGGGGERIDEMRLNEWYREHVQKPVRYQALSSGLLYELLEMLRRETLTEAAQAAREKKVVVRNGLHYEYDKVQNMVCEYCAAAIEKLKAE